MRKGTKQILSLCFAAVIAGIIINFVRPCKVYAENGGEQSAAAATASEVHRDRENRRRATASEGSATPAQASVLAASSSLGDIWDSWSGKTSFEFLSGSQGEGTEKRPYLIKNREQLMGLSELAAMGMTVREAEGTDYAGDYSGCCFALGGNIDLQGVDWIPIGFYRDSSEMAGEVPYPFSGQFDGNGYTVKNLRLTALSEYDNVGLFGNVQDSFIHDLTVISDSKEIRGNDRTGVLTGYAGDSQLRNITVKNSYIKSSGIAGGVAGEISGTVIENAVCDKVMIDAAGGADIIYAGGIAGIASDSAIVDCKVSTGDGTTARIQGTGYIGGILGYQNASDIYNTYVIGTIGGYHSVSIGGITGRYGAGKIKVARFEGSIGNSQMGAMAREGTFIGTRQGAAANFNYIEDVAWLFADSESKISANVCGSEIPDDNDYTYDAHVGYWHGGDLYYTLVQGGTRKNISDRYFYEELEDGILEVTDGETGKSLPRSAGHYTLDHFAPDSLGRPVRGYLLTAGQIDTTANGQNFYDVAVLEARGSSRYSKTVDKEHRGAAAAGSEVSVTTAPRNTDNLKFQMAGTPFYTTESGIRNPAAYSESSHSYTFLMPRENTSVSAVYKKVAVSVRTNPESYTFAVIQTRTGNRKNPVKVTEIRNKEGKLIARYINGILEQGIQAQPVNISAVIDANNDVEDNRVKWSIDDPGLINLSGNDDEGTDGYTAKSASISVNPSASFFIEILQKAERRQADENYRYKIPNTIYGAGHQSGGVAVLTAQTRPAASFEGKPCTANTRINVTFQIIDNTLVAAEGAILDKQAMEFTVTRILTGSRKAPGEKVTVTEPQPLTAFFTPDFFSWNQVIWESSDPAVIAVLQDEEAYREVSVSAFKDAKWIRDIMAADDGIRNNNEYAELSGGGNRNVTVTISGRDKLGNKVSAVCQVAVKFVTDDQTRIASNSRGGSSGGGGGSGGGAHSVGITAAGNTKGPEVPSGAVTGTWTRAANGKWIFASDRTFANEWAYVSNPYAAGSQEKASWFCFDKEGFMVTGWHEEDNDIYYLKCDSDGTQGQMVVGWQYIEGKWYYFLPASGGPKGKLLTDSVTPDGCRVDKMGRWIP